MKKRELYKLGLVAWVFVGAFAYGCSAMSTNDNPISTDQMAQIRAKEASERSHLNSGGQPPVGGAAKSGTTTSGN